MMYSFHLEFYTIYILKKKKNKTKKKQRVFIKISSIRKNRKKDNGREGKLTMSEDAELTTVAY